MPDITETDPARAEDGEIYAKSRSRLRLPLGGGERVISALTGGTFLATAIAMALTGSSRDAPRIAVVAALILAFAALTNVDFEIGAGSAIPTQLVFVPMLFLIPLGWVPLAVAAGYLVSLSVDVVRGVRHRERVLPLLGSCWYVIPPVVVLLVWGDGAPRWDHWPVYIGALGAQFGADLASTLVRERRALDLSLRRLIPFAAYAHTVDLALSPLGLLAAFASMRMPYAFVLVLPLGGVLEMFAHDRKRRFQQEDEMRAAYLGTALLLGDIIDADDEYTGSHSRGVVELVSAVAGSLGLAPEERTQAEFAALLHDIGKIRIPKTIIQKPGPLDPDERRLIETHPEEGERILKQVGGSLAKVGAIVRACHEWYDGTGYPDRKAGEQIPLIARIICCCDAFSAMTTERPYRSARSVPAAVAELRACAGTQFDPRVVDAVVALIEITGEADVELRKAA
ncbi:MAG TPA: HD-GYP domain-containing protein [Gaiellales bacterium]